MQMNLHRGSVILDTGKDEKMATVNRLEKEIMVIFTITKKLAALGGSQ
jgi:hypothetical protein